MCEILKEWLHERLQQPITWEAEEFGKLMKNGLVVANLLHSYHVIIEDQLLQIQPSNTDMDIKNNWNLLKDWLRLVDVHLTDLELNNIKEGNGSALLRLFYQLFLHLDKRDRTNFLKKERQAVSRLVDKLDTRFRVEKVEEGEKSPVNFLAKPLLNEKLYIDWQRKKVAETKDAYDYVKHKYKRMLEKIKESKIPCYQDIPKKKELTDKDKQDMEIFSKKYPACYTNYTYKDLVDLEEATVNKKLAASLAGSEWTSSYMADLHKRLAHNSDSQTFQKQMSQDLSSALWDESVAAEESKVDVNLAKKVMKLSQYEKQMCTQIMETKQQARNLLKNRTEAAREYEGQRDHQFSLYLDHLKDQIHSGSVEINFERMRQDKLHKVLYAEKMKRKRQHYYELCYDIVLALIDYVCRLSYWTGLIGNEIPNQYILEWKNLFYRYQPIFDIHSPMEDLLQKHEAEEEIEREAEEIIRLELNRQETLNDEEFMAYHNYKKPWILDFLLPNYDPESEERKYEYFGGRILSHVVYSLLEIKYPYPPPKPPADLPPFQSKAIIRNLPSNFLTVPMQTLLNHSKIHVVRLEAAINSCLKTFKTEMVGCVEIDLSYDKFTLMAQDDQRKEFIKSLKSDDQMNTPSTDANIQSILYGPIPANCKQTQTPKTLPEEEIILSDGAELGRYAYEALSFGDTLPDHLMAAILVEYIKQQKDINGFVIINYPNSYREAQVLEETFSGREPPDEEELFVDEDDIYLEETIAKHRKKYNDPYKEVRLSKLFKNPHKLSFDVPFESYFTCYLKLLETENILNECVIWDLPLENSELIDRFYAVLGINYSLYYESIEKDLLGFICKYIIGDLSMPLKSSNELFGDDVFSELEFHSPDDKKMKSKLLKHESSTAKSKFEKNSSSRTSQPSAPSAETTIDIYQADADEEGMIEEAEVRSMSGEEIVILAGDDDWEFGEGAISEIIGTSLASCWEVIEKNYIHDMEQVFFGIRLQMNSLIPYCGFIKNKMETIISLPSNKQDLVYKFQKEYNDFEDDWRAINLSKNEWHCRIKELQTSLNNICDDRKIYAEQQKHNLIMDNWASQELTSMTNHYITCMQVELNRSISSLQIIQDFYFCKLSKMPLTERLQSTDFVKVPKDSEDNKKQSADDKFLKHVKAVFQEMHMKDIEMDFSNNPLNLIIDNTVKFGIKIILDINDHFRNLISKEYGELNRSTGNLKKKKISPPPTTVNSASNESANLDDIHRLNALKCVDEWLMAVNGEMYRVLQRLSVLHYKSLHDMKMFNDMITKTFTYIQESINSHYTNEIMAVDRLCKYMQMAVENCVKIPESLILENENFVIDPKLLVFMPLQPPPPPDQTNELVDKNTAFKISQLARLRTMLKIVAPTGIALQQAFIYLLQDFILYGKESSEGSLFPEMFKRINLEKVPQFVVHLFGETTYVDWRDFLIYCLDIRYPSIDELLRIRTKFRCEDWYNHELIDRDKFIDIEFWFEDEFSTSDPHAQLRKILIKHFLFELFETEENKMNYSAFLLALCKSCNPIEGFSKAISMAIGKKNCYVFEECEDVICKLIKDKQYRDASLACARKCANEFLDTLINNVVQICVSTTVEEVAFDPEELIKPDKKGKKGKGKDDVKSAKKNVAASKKTSSDTNIKQQVYICPPCEPEPEIPEKEKEEEIEYEESVSINILEDYAYAVPQDVIWKVLRICLPWHFALVPDRKPTPYEDRVKEVFKRLEVFADDGNIYIAQFVRDPAICKILHKVKKFTALCIAEEIEKVCS